MVFRDVVGVWDAVTLTSHCNDCRTHQGTWYESRAEGPSETKDERTDDTSSRDCAAALGTFIANPMERSVNDEKSEKMDEESFARVAAETRTGEERQKMDFSEEELSNSNLASRSSYEVP